MAETIEQKKPTSRFQRLALAAAVLFLLAVLFGRAIQREFLISLILRSDAPDPVVVQELIDQSAHPAKLLRKLWQTKKIPHRLQVMSHLNSLGQNRPELFEAMQPVLLEAAHDVDGSVREIALAILAARHQPGFLRLAQDQLRDADPELRRLGLQYVRTHGDKTLVRAVVPFLDDPEPRVAVAAAHALRAWTGNDFGARAHLIVANEDQDGQRKVDLAKLEAATQALQRWKEWWKTHEQDYPALSAAAAAQPGPSPRLLANDFALSDLAGESVRLSDFKGKVVLLNFWTTWCTACWSEIPDLIELQRRRPELVLLGISLDGLPDEHDHGHDGKPSEENGLAAKSKHAAGIAEIRDKVQQFAKTKGINYRVLLNPSGEVGARFNGHELPTNVLIDREGKVRRRFLGSRTPVVFEAMLDDLDTTQPRTR